MLAPVKRPAAIEATLAIARASTSEVFEEEGFVLFLRERQGLKPTHGGELLLVYLWSVGSAEAQKRLDTEFFNQLPVVVAAIDRSPAFVADVVQELKTKLFVEKKLLQYAGRGPLGGWLRTAALNTASTLHRPQRREAPLDPMSESIAPDAELTFLKARYREDFRGAFVDALASLSTRERTVLRLNSLSGVSIDELGAMYSVHRATAARWVQSARQLVVERTRENLVKRLKLDEEELDEMLTLMRSQLDVSLRHYMD
jgi:RNA polymerase sigma-70 factor (ECF subfamily)